MSRTLLPQLLLLTRHTHSLSLAPLAPGVSECSSRSRREEEADSDGVEMLETKSQKERASRLISRLSRWPPVVSESGGEAGLVAPARESSRRRVEDARACAAVPLQLLSQREFE